MSETAFKTPADADGFFVELEQFLPDNERVIKEAIDGCNVQMLDRLMDLICRRVDAPGTDAVDELLLRSAFMWLVPLIRARISAMSGGAA